MRFGASRLVQLILLLAVASFLASAQDVTGSIAGVVTDSTGAVVPNATVVITNTDRNSVARTLTTGAEGEYSAVLLPVGNYMLSVTAAGFKKSERSGVVLNVNEKLGIDVALEVGQATEVVNVQEAPVQVETQSAETAGLITGTQVRELSLNNRNYEQLVALMPGVVSGASDQIYVGVSNPSGQTNTVSFSINGGRNSQNNWTVDGADNVDRGSNATLLNYPSVDAIAEFKVLRSTYSAEFGRGGAGQINVVTKSGTSRFHGDAYEFVRNDAFSANQFLNNANRVNLGRDGKARVPPLRYNNFGYTIGGPLFIPHVYNRDKNKTFFFFSQEYRRIITYSTVQAFVPTGSEKQGIFPDPVCVAVVSGKCTQTSNTITQINPVATAYLKDIYAAIPNGDASNSIFSALRNIFNYRQELYKVDHVFSSNYGLSVRYLRDSIPTVEPGGLFTGAALPGVSTTSTNSPGHSLVIRGTQNFTPTLINEAGYAYSYGAITSDVTGTVSSALSPDVKVALPFTTTLARIPSISIAGGSTITGFGPYRDFNRNYNVFDNLTKIAGRHTLKLGLTANFYSKTENAGGGVQGAFTFSQTPRPTGTPVFEQAFANFLLGNAASFTQTSQDLTPYVHGNEYEAYVNDDFHVNSRLTLNLGLRYSLFRQPYDTNNLLTNFDPRLYDPAKAPQIDAKGNIVPGTGDPLNGIIVASNNTRFPGHKISQENYKNWAPRVGLAYDPFGDGKTAIRAGYGIYYDLILFGVYEQNEFANPPFVNSVTVTNTSLSNPVAGTQVISASPKVLHGTPANYQTPYTQNWSFDIQRQIRPSLVLDVAYVGTKGTHLPGIVDINEAAPGAAIAAGIVPAGTVFTSANTQLLNQVRPYRGYASINSIENWFNSEYNGLQMFLDKRFANNSLMTVSYTYSKALTDNRSDRSSAPQNTYNFNEGERGLAQFDRRHVFTMSYVYEIPFLRHSQSFAGKAIGGWEVSGITQIDSGLPLNVTSSLGTDPAGLGIIGASAAGPRPDALCNPNVGAPRTYAMWFATSCFADVPAGQVRPGNAGRSIINGPGFVRFDVSLFKNFRFNESTRLQLRGEAFNIANHTNADTVSTALGSSTYGRVTGFRDPRIIQLAAKFEF